MQTLSTKVEVQVYSSDYGPHTRKFSVRFYVMLESECHLALQLGCAGNRSTENGRYWVNIPSDFDTLDHALQAQILCAEVKRQGAFISYVSGITGANCDGTNIQPHDCTFSLEPEAIFFEPVVVPPKSAVRKTDRVVFVKTSPIDDNNPR